MAAGGGSQKSNGNDSLYQQQFNTPGSVLTRSNVFSRMQTPLKQDNQQEDAGDRRSVPSIYVHRASLGKSLKKGRNGSTTTPSASHTNTMSMTPGSAVKVPLSTSNPFFGV